jgi:XTP/dITP diphosphohydrolase
VTKLLLATNNLGKLKEIQALLGDLEVELITPQQIGLVLDVVEDGKTYAENAERKARAFARYSGMLTLADDSGLEVAALGGQPGIRSARFSPLPDATDADRRAYLLGRLKDHSRPWLAQFHCTVALTTPSGEVYFAEGKCSGEIIPEERGSNGFGYDPIFFIPEMGRTMAELEMEEKNHLSHRARAIKAARPVLTKLLTD